MYSTAGQRVVVISLELFSSNSVKTDHDLADGLDEQIRSSGQNLNLFNAL